MTAFTAFVLLLFLIVAVVSIVRIIRYALPFGARAFLICLRLVLLALLAAAFIEPVFVFERLPSSRRPVPVLIDASLSMRLFLPDSAAAPLLSALNRWNRSRKNSGPGFVFYWFGDSIRAASGAPAPSWQDRRSYFPETFSTKTLNQAASLLIVSDGNWSNALAPVSALADKNVYYLPLPAFRHYPYVHVELAPFAGEAPLDSTLAFRALVEGFASSAGPLLVSVREKKRSVIQRTVAVTKGYFNREIALPVQTGVPGRHLYSVEARLQADSLAASCSALHSALPGKFVYGQYSGRPGLDNRFLQLAFRRRKDFSETKDDKISLDLLVLFDWNREAEKKLERLKPRGALLFLGCLPCSSSVIAGGPAQQLVRAVATTTQNPFDDLNLNALPPASRYFFCKNGPPRNLNTLMSVVAPKSNGGPFDTINAVFTGRLHSVNFVACAAGDVWRWDFWPLSVETDENRVFTFSDRLISLTKEVLVNGLSEDLLLFPSAPLRESDSVRLQAALPADLPLPCDMHFSCSFSSGARRYDTAFTFAATGSMRQSVAFTPLAAGTWFFQAEAKANNRRYGFSDSITVDQDRSEYMVKGQNVPMLQEFAQPMTDFSDSSLANTFFNPASQSSLPIKDVFHLNRNWFLLIAIFTVFAAEWIARRVLKLD